MRPRRRFLALTHLIPFGCLLCLYGCAHLLDEQGTAMRASFELEDNECGNGVFEAAEEVDFDVAVTIDGDDVEWYVSDTGEYLLGAVSDDSFLITESRTLDQEDGCRLEVTSRYVGTFEEDAGSLVDVDGLLTISYEATDEALCAGWVGTASGFQRLPCDVVYSFDLDVDE